MGISIRDTGRGIKKEDLKNIFKPFFTTRERGVGLGLAICDKIVRNHGGTIRVKSIPGQEVFSISSFMPPHEELDAMAKILVVDDELNMRLVLSAMLKKEGYSVSTASDGIEALEIIQKDPVDVIVTDLKMPRLDGMGLLEKVTDRYPSLPVIIITAHGTVATAVDALKKGLSITSPSRSSKMTSKT